MKKLVVLTGAGVSAESGIKTFRDSDGLWEEHDVMSVASPEGWAKDPRLVLRFYNERRKQLALAEPNQGHMGLARLEKYFDVDIITQNVDNLHERAGSSKVLHLHGRLTQVRSTGDPAYIRDIGYEEIHLGDLCPKGYQLRPDIVWFGEQVPAIEPAVEIASKADIFMVVGTSMAVYPAAGLINYVPPKTPIYLVDPNPVDLYLSRKIHFIQEKAGTGVHKVIDLLTKDVVH